MKNSDPISRLNAALEGRYLIERELGEGGMATVYLADDIKHGRKVALKVLKPELAATMGPERFLREIRVTANLQHPHILPLFDSGEADGFLFYVMPFLDGESLRERIAREGELPVTEAVKILREVVDALSAAHEMGVVHRDIKPDNVLLSGRHAVVTDFGVAKAVSEATGRHELTTKGVALGTPAYMAPEQAAANDHIDHRADIYAVGALGYELLAGRPPFTGMTSQQVLAAHVTETPRPVTELRTSVPQALGDVLMRCLEKKPADRWQSADELLGQLELFATPTTGVTPTQMTPTRAAAPTGGVPRWMKVAAPIGLAGIVFAVWMGSREPAVDANEEASTAPANIESGFVVVPFVNQTGVDSLNVFGSVVADYLTGQISRNRIGWVSATSTVRDLTDERPADSEVVGYFSEATGARYVVTGTYYRQGAALIVQAEVTDGTTSELVASVGPIEGPSDDYMALAGASAEQILVVLARLLDPTAAPPSVAGVPPTYAAYQDYMEGLGRWRQGDRERALDLFYRALEADSTYAEALLMASTTEWNTGDIPKADSIIQVAQRYRRDMAPWDVVSLDWLQGWFDGDREAIYQAGRRWAELDPVRGGDCRGARIANRLQQAIEDCMRQYDQWFDKTGLLGFSWTDLLVALHLLGEHYTELEHSRTARRHNPSAQRAFVFEAQALAALGLTSELRILLDEAKTHGSDDFSVGNVIREAGLELRAHGQPELGDELIRNSLDWYTEMGTNNNDYAWSLFANRDFDETVAVCDGLLVDSPEDGPCLGLKGSAQAALGNREMALAAGERLLELEEGPYTFGAYSRWRAAISAQLGDKERAVEDLDEAYREGQSYGTWLHNWPQFDSLRGYPGFERFIAPRN